MNEGAGQIRQVDHRRRSRPAVVSRIAWPARPICKGLREAMFVHSLLGMTSADVFRRVDAGVILDGLVAFPIMDPAVRGRRIWALSSAGLLSLTALLLVAGANLHLTYLLVIGLGLLALLSTPIVDEGREDAKPPMVVITATTLLRRDADVVQKWNFDDLNEVQLSRYGDRLDLILVDRNGKRAFIDCRLLQGAERLEKTLAAHVPLTVL